MDTAMENLNAPTKTNLDTEGDVILVVGETQDEIRVSSRALCAASKPLSALLTGSWREASEAQTRSATEPFRLKLPEDSIEHLRIECAILHLRHHLIPEPIDVSEECLHQFALTAHKYDLGAALKFVSLYWIRFFVEKWRTRMVKDDAQFRAVTRTADNIDPNLCIPLRDLAVAAYALDDAESFWEGTLLLCLAIPLKSSSIGEIEGLFSDTVIVPSRLGNAIRTTVHKNYDFLDVKIATELRRLANGEYMKGVGGRKHHHGRHYHANMQTQTMSYVSGVHDALFSQFFTEQVHVMSLWPYWSDGAKHNIAEHLKQLHEFEDLTVDLFTVTDPSSAGPSTQCRACNLSISQLARSIARQGLAGMFGVCLVCLRDGNEDVKCGECEKREHTSDVVNSF